MARLPCRPTSQQRLRANTSGYGFVDLTLVRDRVLFRELKVGNNKPSPDQDEWINRLDECGADVDVWTPKDWDLIEATLRR